MYYRRFLVIVILIIWLSGTLIEAEQLEGKIVYGEKQPCQSCDVLLKNLNRTTQSNSNGDFSFDIVALKNSFAFNRVRVAIQKNSRISIWLPEMNIIKITLFNTQGRLIQTLFNRLVPQGAVAIELPSMKLSQGFYFIQVDIGSEKRTFKYLPRMTCGIQHPVLNSDNDSHYEIALTQDDIDAIDTLIISCKGFAQFKAPVNTYNQNMGDITIKSPNIIFILADDLGYGEVSTFRRQFVQHNTKVYFETPELDKMAAQGMIFTDFYAGNTVSGPSRCSLMSGKHPGHATVRGNKSLFAGTNTWGDTTGLNPSVDTAVTQVLKKANYTNGLFGKWHLEKGHGNYPTYPESFGFDEVLREDWYIGTYWDNYTQNYPWVLYSKRDKPIPFDMNRNNARGYYLDDINTDSTFEFMSRHKDKSFFIFVSYKTPHKPLEYTDISMFANKTWPNVEKRHAARIQRIDHSIGHILKKLDTLGISEHTMVLFSSDNGPHNEGHDHKFFDSNGDLRGFKRALYEGGIRVPTIAYWKGMIEPGSKSAHPAAFWDFLATCADIAGVKSVPTNHDGLSFLPAMLGKPQPAHDYLYWEFYENANTHKQAARMGKWKAVKIKSGATQLFNLDSDISESNNIAGSNPNTVATLDSIMRIARTSTPLYWDP